MKKLNKRTVLNAGVSVVRSAVGSQDFSRYRHDPVGFAREILGSRWWSAQENIARLLARNRRVAVKAANGVGKTYLAADLALWFLYSNPDSVVLTTAPTWRQVETLLWNEIRRRHSSVNGLAEREPGRPALEGSLLQTRLKISEAHFAMGLSTDEPVRFQGFHAENLLVVLDEACGVEDEIWDAVEGICVGANNRVLAISNPLAPNGRFYSLFRGSRWKTVTISALEHPNVICQKVCEKSHHGKRKEPARTIPGAITRLSVVDRVKEWCEQIEEMEEAEKPSGHSGLILRWEGKIYRPNALFRARVMGEFPESAEDSLLEIDQIEAAMNRSVSERPEERDDLCVLAVDVARFGTDETVFALRQGDSVLWLRSVQGMDTMQVAGRVLAMAQEARAEVIAIDEIGVGAGVVDRLKERNVAGVQAVNFAKRPEFNSDIELYLNQRAQTYWKLRERFIQGRICLPVDDVLKAQLSNIRYSYTSSGHIKIESKDDMRRRGLSSPDRADAVAMLFGADIGIGYFASIVGQFPQDLEKSESVMPAPWETVKHW